MSPRPPSPRALALVLTLLVSASAVLDGRAPTAKQRYETAERKDAEVRAALAQVPPEAASVEIDRVVRPARTVLLDYEQVVRRFPTSGYSDNALLQAAVLAQHLYGRYGRAADRVSAAKYYDWLIREYPASSLQRQARTAVQALDSLKPADRRAAAPPVAAPPASRPAPERPPAAAPPTKAPAAAAAPAPATLRAVERTVLGDTIRVTLALDRETPFSHEVLAGPPRTFVDLFGATATAALQDRTLRFDGDVDAVRQVRIGRRRDAVRVVLDLDGATPVSVFTLYNPYRVVIDAERTAAARARSASAVAAPPASPPAAASAATPADAPVAVAPAALPLAPPSALVPVAIDAALPVQPVDERLIDVTPVERAPSPADDALPPLPFETERRAAPAPASSGPSSLAAVLPPATPTAVVVPPPRRPTATVLRQAPLPAAPAVEAPLPAPVTPAPSVPAANRDGSFSLARQLGLGISRIVIDAGHGGHDPGTPTRGTSEAKLVLDVALRLEKLLLKEGFDVVMTRRSDVFIPLEERTAIANREGADLFVSIHANSGRDPKARGVETYYLSFASNPEAEAVAARENATSTSGMHNLPSIVRAIALNNKLDESRDLAQMVQQSLATRLAKSNVGMRNRGVKKAPFVVLIGAQMPSILAEIGFITNRQEVALIKTPAYRQKIAESLEAAVLQYQRALKRQTTVAATR